MAKRESWARDTIERSANMLPRASVPIGLGSHCGACRGHGLQTCEHGSVRNISSNNTKIPCIASRNYSTTTRSIFTREEGLDTVNSGVSYT